MAGRGTSVCLTLLFFAVLPFVSADQNIITKTGEMVSLPCRAPNNKIRVIEWRRPDLKPELVLVYRGGRLVLGDQHPSFKNRVDLQDRQMKDGNVSLIVKNVTNGDDGTYKCRVFMEETLSWEHINNITLSIVVPPGQTGGHTEDGSVGLKVGLPVFGLLVVAVAFVF